MRKRVVVTGMGTVSPLGNSLSESWSALCAGISGIGAITKFDATGYSVRIAGEVKGFDPLVYVSRSEARRFDDFILYAVAAARMASQDANFHNARPDANSLGVIIGSAVGGLSTIENTYHTLITAGPNKLSPFAVPCSLANMASGVVSIYEGARGLISCPTTACAAGTQAIELASLFIRNGNGNAKAFIAGGTEATVTPLAVGGFGVMRTLSTRNDEPQKASRPFDKNRDGFVIAEGAGIIILEEMESALKRGARIYAELIGTASSADAFHIAAPPEGHEGAARCMQEALNDASLSPADVDYINAHATATVLNDAYEAQAIKNIFGTHATSRLLVSSTKSMTGHMLGAAGGFEAIVAIKAITEGIVAPTINWEAPDENSEGIDFVANAARKADINIAMSCSFGFGGVNAALIFKRWKE